MMSSQNAEFIGANAWASGRGAWDAQPSGGVERLRASGGPDLLAFSAAEACSMAPFGARLRGVLSGGTPMGPDLLVWRALGDHQ